MKEIVLNPPYERSELKPWKKYGIQLPKGRNAFIVYAMTASEARARLKQALTKQKNPKLRLPHDTIVTELANEQRCVIPENEIRKRSPIVEIKQ